MRGGIVIILCTNKVLTTQGLGRAIATNDLKKIEFQIKHYGDTPLMQSKRLKMCATPLLFDAAIQHVFDVQGSEEATLHKIYKQKIIETPDMYRAKHFL